MSSVWNCCTRLAAGPMSSSASSCAVSYKLALGKTTVTVKGQSMSVGETAVKCALAAYTTVVRGSVRAKVEPSTSAKARAIR